MKGKNGRDIKELYGIGEKLKLYRMKNKGKRKWRKKVTKKEQERGEKKGWEREGSKTYRKRAKSGLDKQLGESTNKQGHKSREKN